MANEVKDACDIFDVVNTEFLSSEFIRILNSSKQHIDIAGFYEVKPITSYNKHEKILKYQDGRTKRKYKLVISITTEPLED